MNSACMCVHVRTCVACAFAVMGVYIYFLRIHLSLERDWITYRKVISSQICTEEFI